METTLPEENALTTHQQVRAQGKDLLRQAIIDAAQHLLVQEGPEALTVRRLANVLQCSTKVVYTLFRGKDGVANALYLEGCRLLSEAMRLVSATDEVGTYVRKVAWVYWDFAEQNECFYRVMFCGAIPHFHPDEANTQHMTTAFATIVAQLDTYRQQGTLATHDAQLLMKSFWAPLHGVISLFLLGHFDRSEAHRLYEETIAALLRAYPATPM